MAEGAPLLREYRVKSLIEGSNPSHSARHKKSPALRGFFLCLVAGACVPVAGFRRDEKKQADHQSACFDNGAPGEIRTPDRLVRSQVLYPAELRARFVRRGILHERFSPVNNLSERFSRRRSSRPLRPVPRVSPSRRISELGRPSHPQCPSGARISRAFTPMPGKWQDRGYTGTRALAGVN